MKPVLTILFAVLAASCGGRQASVTEEVTEAAVVATPSFSADSAYAFVAKQVAFGPRVPRSQAHEQCAAWLAAELQRHGADTVVLQQASLPEFGPMTNIMGRFNLQSPTRILLLSHWDSRPWADEDPDPANHSKPIDGANDGASGVGVLLELARLMGQQTPDVGVDILLVDAEDSGTSGDDDSWALGTQYWVENMPFRPTYAVLLDMVGGRGAVFPRELFSDVNARVLNDRIWRIAGELGLGSVFINRQGGAVNDDHVPLLRAGIPAVDIIETDHPATGSFNPTWHTLQDNIDNIDAVTLGQVGSVVTALIYREKP